MEWIFVLFCENVEFQISKDLVIKQFVTSLPDVSGTEWVDLMGNLYHKSKRKVCQPYSPLGSSVKFAGITFVPRNGFILEKVLDGGLNRIFDMANSKIDDWKRYWILATFPISCHTVARSKSCQLDVVAHKTSKVLKIIEKMKVQFFTTLLISQVILRQIEPLDENSHQWHRIKNWIISYGIQIPEFSQQLLSIQICWSGTFDFGVFEKPKQRDCWTVEPASAIMNQMFNNFDVQFWWVSL